MLKLSENIFCCFFPKIKGANPVLFEKCANMTITRWITEPNKLRSGGLYIPWVGIKRGEMIDPKLRKHKKSLLRNARRRAVKSKPPAQFIKFGMSRWTRKGWKARSAGTPVELLKSGGEKLPFEYLLIPPRYNSMP